MPIPYSASLHGRRVLVVEDSYLIAQELTEALEREGADVIGPVSTLEDARRLAYETPKLDAAVLDVNLRGEMVWPVADLLADRHVQLLFATAYAAAPIKERYSGCQVVQKPAPPRMIVRLLSSERLATPQDPLEGPR